MSAEDVQLYYQICVNGRKDLPYASDEQAAFDMTLLRLFAFKPMQKGQLPPAEANVQHQEVTDVFQEQNFELSASPKDLIENKPVKVDDAILTASEVTETSTSSPDLAEHKLPEPASAVQESSALVEQELAQQMQAIEQQATQIQESTSTPSQNLSRENVAVSDSAIDSPVNAVLATRNMLRSRKKKLKKQEKKPSDANARQANLAEQKTPKKDTSALEEKKVELPKPEQAYKAENIDPATIRKANQVDKWAHMIDSMELIARLRQLAIHATIDENSTEDNLILRLDQATKHLYTEIAQQQLQQSISQFLSRAVNVTINIVEETVADPYKIQSHINDKRYDYAKELLEKDNIVQGLVQSFQATLDDESISAI